MTTFAEMKTNVARDLRDPSKLTFQDDTLGDLVNAALAEIGRISPQRFTQDIPLAENQTEYYVWTTVDVYTLTTPFGVASTNVLTCASHNLTANTPIRFTYLTGGTGLVAGITYYVSASGLTANDFKVSSIVGGAAVDFTTNITEGQFVRSLASPPNPEVEINRVQLMDHSVAPPNPLGLLLPEASEYVNYSEAGWRFWGGALQIPRWVVVAYWNTDTQLRVWGYAPYVQMASESDVLGLSAEQEWALRAYCRVEALQRLIFERDLFSQWQIRSNNTDVSPAALMNSLSLAQADWNRRSRQIAVLREAP